MAPKPEPSPRPSARSDASTSGDSTLSSEMVFGLCFLMIICHILFGTGLFSYLMDWSIFESLWFSVITCTTVGYGDYVPNENSVTKIFGAFYIWLSLLLLSFALGLMSCAKLSKAEEEDEGERQRAILMSIGQLVLVLAIGTILFPLVDESGSWSFVDGFYYTSVTLSTVGYGAVIPQGELAKSIGMVYIFVGVNCTASLISNVVDGFIDAKKRKDRERFFTQRLDVHKLEAMNDGIGGVNEAEFLQFMLSETGLVDEGEIKYIRETFAKMDTDNSGELSIEDLLHSELMTKAADHSKHAAMQSPPASQRGTSPIEPGSRTPV